MKKLSGPEGNDSWNMKLDHHIHYSIGNFLVLQKRRDFASQVSTRPSPDLSNTSGQFEWFLFPYHLHSTSVTLQSSYFLLESCLETERWERKNAKQNSGILTDFFMWLNCSLLTCSSFLQRALFFTDVIRFYCLTRKIRCI